MPRQQSKKAERTDRSDHAALTRTPSASTATRHVQALHSSPLPLSQNSRHGDFKRLRSEGPTAVVVGRTADTEEDLQMCHGQLTQLNDLFPPSTSGGSSRGASVEPPDPREEAARNKDARQQARLRALRTMPSHCLPVYTTLVESGVPAADRAFVAVVVSRALHTVQRWQ